MQTHRRKVAASVSSTQEKILPYKDMVAHCFGNFHNLLEHSCGEKATYQFLGAYTRTDVGIIFFTKRWLSYILNSTKFSPC